MLKPAPGDLAFGVPELLAAVDGRRRVLDAGCGSGRLTVALARAGHEVTGRRRERGSPCVVRPSAPATPVWSSRSTRQTSGSRSRSSQARWTPSSAGWC